MFEKREHARAQDACFYTRKYKLTSSKCCSFHHCKRCENKRKKLKLIILLNDIINFDIRLKGEFVCELHFKEKYIAKNYNKFRLKSNLDLKIWPTRFSLKIFMPFHPGWQPLIFCTWLPAQEYSTPVKSTASHVTPWNVISLLVMTTGF